MEEEWDVRSEPGVEPGTRTGSDGGRERKKKKIKERFFFSFQLQSCSSIGWWLVGWLDPPYPAQRDFLIWADGTVVYFTYTHVLSFSLSLSLTYTFLTLNAFSFPPLLQVLKRWKGAQLFV